jgi:cytochrome c556
MRRFVVTAAAVAVACSGVVIAQKVSSADDLDKVMKRAGAFRQVDKAIQSNNAGDAKAQLAIVRQAVLDSQSFWIEHKKQDAVKLNKDALAKLDELEKTLSAQPFDVATATAKFKETGGSCRACHQQYRAEDDNNNYILKPGSVAGVSH